METKNWKQQVESLSSEQQQLLKDTINYGSWGDGGYEFLDENGNCETYEMYGYCTNDAKHGGHFNGRQISGLFRWLFKVLCPNNGVGRFFSHCSDWWGDGTGDMLFVRYDILKEVENWAKNC